MPTDIHDRTDIEHLISTFYEALLKDNEMQYIFFEVAQVDLPSHLPILCDFWENLLFHTGKYRRNAMRVHMDLNIKHKLMPLHFDLWLQTFEQTVDRLYKGEIANRAKQHARSVAQLMQWKVEQLNH